MGLANSLVNKIALKSAAKTIAKETLKGKEKIIKASRDEIAESISKAFPDYTKKN